MLKWYHDTIHLMIWYLCTILKTLSDIDLLVIWYFRTILSLNGFLSPSLLMRGNILQRAVTHFTCGLYAVVQPVTRYLSGYSHKLWIITRVRQYS